MASTTTKYVPLVKAVVDILVSAGGEVDYTGLVRAILKRYGNGERRTTLRVFQRPDGSLWSPELDEALAALEMAGTVRVENNRVRLTLS